MRTVLFTLFFAGWGVSNLVCAPPSVASLISTNCEVVWKAPTNNWARTLWTYKVQPQVFSPIMISNLLVMGGLSEGDKCRKFGDTSFEDKFALRYKNADESKRLGIYPSFGCVRFIDAKAEAVNQFQLVTNVPTPEEATRLGMAWLKRFGIETSDLAKKDGNDELDLHWERGTIGYIDPASKSEKTLTNMCGVFFLRQIDGIHFKGIGLNGGVEINFGNNNKVAQLELNWRKIVSYQKRKCMSPQDLLSGIKSGSIPLPAKIREFGQINRINITRAIPLYDGSFGDERQEMIVPFVTLEAHIFGTRKEGTMIFDTDILKRSK